jgi:repressor LexA
MERKPLSPRQLEIFEFIKKELKAKGYPPTILEITVELDLNSTFGVRKHLEALEEKGYIIREPGLSRAIRIVQ